MYFVSLGNVKCFWAAVCINEIRCQSVRHVIYPFEANSVQKVLKCVFCALKLRKLQPRRACMGAAHISLQKDRAAGDRGGSLSGTPPGGDT